MCAYVATLASVVRARLAGVIIETDVTDFSEFDRAILDRERQTAFDLLIKRQAELHDAAVHAGAVFQNAVKQHGLQGDTFFKTCTPVDIPDVVMELARLYDCAVLPASEKFDGLHVPLVEEVLFGSGRPLILVPRESRRTSHLVSLPLRGMKAARAVHDAIPLLRQATWPAPGSEDTELGVLMGPEGGHGETEVHSIMRRRRGLISAMENLLSEEWGCENPQSSQTAGGHRDRP
jgi:hypothetical protein